ncbi:MAG: response regulator [Desulfobacterales bacterium]
MATDAQQARIEPVSSGFLGVGPDAGRKAFSEIEQTAHALLNAAPTAAFLVDVTGVILAVNHLAAARIDIPVEMMIGRSLAEFFPPDVAEFRKQKGMEVIRERKPVFFEDTCEGRVFSNSVHPICDEHGRIVKLAIHSKDITEERRSEEERRKLTIQLQQAQKMEAIGTLAGGIAHDFNNLLMAIQGNVSLMLFDTPASQAHHRALINIEKLVRSGADLTSKLLGYARKGKYESRPILLNDLAAETAETFGRMRKEIRIECRFASDLKGIIADRGQIEQVLLNMFVNAADAMPAGGRLLLQTDNVTHREIPPKGYTVRPGEYVRLRVVDSGVGIDPLIIDRIFDPFFTTKKMGHGTGLGLASAYGIVKGHNGYIDVESKPGAGAVFFVYFPATVMRPGPSADRPCQPLDGSGSVLLVDDEQTVLEVTAELIRKLGYTVFCASSGREALGIFAREGDRIDVVILDMIMPEMGGGEVFDQLRRTHPRVKVLLASGYSLQGQAREIMNRGCDGFLQKPFTLDDLSVRLRSIIPAAPPAPGI